MIKDFIGEITQTPPQFYLPVAHGEGKFFMDQDTLNQLIENNCTALRYIDDNSSYADLFSTS